MTKVLMNSYHSVLVAALVPAVWASAFYLRSEGLRVSHLSPLLRYEPADAWNHTLEASWSSSPGASVTYQHWGRSFTLSGTPPSNGTINTAEPPYEEHEPTWHSSPGHAMIPVQGYPTEQNQSFYMGVSGYSSRLRWRNVSLVMADDSSEGLEEGDRVMNVTGLSYTLPMPVDGEYYESLSESTAFAGRALRNRAEVIMVPTTHPEDSTLNDFYTVQGGWHVAPLNATIASSTSAVLDIWQPKITYNAPDDFQRFVNTTILSINSSSATNDAELHFTATPRASLFQLFGSVGPDMGRVSITINPTSTWSRGPGEEDLVIPIRNLTGPQEPAQWSNTFELDLSRPVEATGILLLAVPIDARAPYEITLRPYFDGRSDVTRVELNGATFATYARADDSRHEDNWVKDDHLELEYRMGWRSRPGLSGGQIAGIVVGSVAGALILGGLLFWSCRRERRKQNEANRRGSAMSDDQRTMTGSTSVEHGSGKV